MIQCPHCGTMMQESAQFCPGCGAPRTATRERLQHRAAETGIPYEQLLIEAREEDRQAHAGAWTQPAAAGPAPPARQNNRLWWVLGIIGGLTLLACLGCLLLFWIVRRETSLSFGEGGAGQVARQYLEAGSRGEFDRQWDLLHPRQQDAVPQDVFVACGVDAGIRDITILLEFNEDVDVPRVGFVTTRVVTYALSRDGSNTGEMARMVQADGSWRWTLEGDVLRAYEAGRCPT
jgi:hypothetical protein